jgi:Do/DeqQ family serine protease
MKRKSLPWLFTAAFFLVLGFALTAGNDLTPEAQADKLWKDGNNNPAALNASDPVRLDSFAKLAKALSPAVVFIQVERHHAYSGPFNGFNKPFGHSPRGFHNRGMGSGFIIHEDGWVLTNSHVVNHADRIQVKLANNSIYQAKVVGIDPRTDVALLKIEPREKLTVAPLGNSSKQKIGSWVIAIGNPFGLSHTVTAGIVSGKGRRNVHPDTRTVMGRQMYENFIQTDASINPGNSGGPLINIRGEVIGINTAINAAGQGIGFAIPINMVKTLIPQLKTGRVLRSWLGVMIQPVSNELASKLGMKHPRGALVAEVMQNGPADRSGIEAGDIIEEFDGKPILESSELPWLASTAGAGNKITVRLQRNGKRFTRTVVMASMPLEPEVRLRRGKKGKRKRTESSALGLRVKAITPILAARLNAGVGRGVVVTELDVGGPAAQAGVEAGDLILKMNYESVNTEREFVKAMRSVSQGGVVSLSLRRGQRKLFIAFTKP